MRQEMTLTWNDSAAFIFSAPPMMHKNPRKRTVGKTRIRQSGRHRVNLIKTKRPNTPKNMISKLIDIDFKAPIPTKGYDRFGLSCTYCRHGALHLPAPQEPDWSSKDWDNTKTKTQDERR